MFFSRGDDRVCQFAKSQSMNLPGQVIISGHINDSLSQTKNHAIYNHLWPEGSEKFAACILCLLAHWYTLGWRRQSGYSNWTRFYRHQPNERQKNQHPFFTDTAQGLGIHETCGQLMEGGSVPKDLFLLKSVSFKKAVEISST